MNFKQGAQWYAMGRELLERYPLFKNSMTEAGLYLQSLGCSWFPVSKYQSFLLSGQPLSSLQASNTSIPYADEILNDPAHTNVNNTQYSQPLWICWKALVFDQLLLLGTHPGKLLQREALFSCDDMKSLTNLDMLLGPLAGSQPGKYPTGAGCWPHSLAAMGP
jgi:hypothetical protein